MFVSANGQLQRAKAEVEAKAKSVLMMVLGYRSERNEVLMSALLETQRSQRVRWRSLVSSLIV